MPGSARYPWTMPTNDVAPSPARLASASGLATVSADGTVTGRAAGTAQLVALGTASDGAVRVTVVRVVVQP